MVRLLIVFVYLVSCSNRSSDKSLIKEQDDSATITSRFKTDTTIGQKTEHISLTSIKDTLTKEERAFLDQIEKENEFILLSRDVIRYYTNDLKTLVCTELKYSDSFLQENGYVSMSLKFLGQIAPVKISYSYSLGQASFGYGSVVGNGVNDYLHSFNSCGVTNCIVNVFKNKTKILERQIPNN